MTGHCKRLVATDCEIWDRFCESFVAGLEATENLHHGWMKDTTLEKPSASRSRRTRIYESIYWCVAQDFGMLWDKKEYHKVDAAIGPKVDGIFVPRIFIESENKAADAEAEVACLSMFSADLKVLITCDIWSDCRGNDVGRANRDRWLPHWRNIVAAHASKGVPNCPFGLIVAERTGAVLRFFRAMLSDSRPALAGEGDAFYEVRLDARVV